MRLQMKGKAEAFTCEQCKGPGPRGRLSDGTWTNMCEACVQIFKDHIAAWKKKANPLWFLKGDRRP